MQSWVCLEGVRFQPAWLNKTKRQQLQTESHDFGQWRW